jgi:hypothetical protein
MLSPDENRVAKAMWQKGYNFAWQIQGDDRCLYAKSLGMMARVQADSPKDLVIHRFVVQEDGLHEDGTL